MGLRKPRSERALPADAARLLEEMQVEHAAQLARAEAAKLTALDVAERAVATSRHCVTLMERQANIIEVQRLALDRLLPPSPSPEIA